MADNPGFLCKVDLLKLCRGYSLNLAKLSYGYSPHYRVYMVEKSSPVGGASLAYICKCKVKLFALFGAAMRRESVGRVTNHM